MIDLDEALQHIHSVLAAHISSPIEFQAVYTDIADSLQDLYDRDE